MNYFKGILRGLSALFLAEWVPCVSSVFKEISQERATGLAAVSGGLVETALSPLFWIFAVLFFALFFAAGRLRSRALRILLFWIPAVTFSLVFVVGAAGLTYLFVHFRQP